MYQYYSVIIGRVISAPVHGKEVVGCLNVIDKLNIFKSMSNLNYQDQKHLIHGF